MHTLNALLMETAQNNSTAFKQLYTETSPKLFSLCLRLVNYDNETAEDVLQEAYIKIWNKAEKFNAEKGNALSWMGRVVRNQAFDRLRSYKSRPELVEEADFETIEYSSKDEQPEQCYSHFEQVSLFKEMLESLPEKQRECITQSIVYGRSHAEIAVMMQVPLGTVKAWIRRNMRVLQETMLDNAAYDI